MALGIHVDTGSLTYEGATPRDALALSWLMANGANQRAIADYIEPGFSQETPRHSQGCSHHARNHHHSRLSISVGVN